MSKNDGVLDLYRTIIDLIKDAVDEGDVDVDDVGYELSLAQHWADGFVTAKLNRVED